MKITNPYTCEFLVNSLTFAICIFWYHLMQINLPMIILGQMIVFCNWFHWKFNNFTQKISTFIPICFEKLFALFASICLRTILFAEKCKQFLFANDLQSIVATCFWREHRKTEHFMVNFSPEIRNSTLIICNDKAIKIHITFIKKSLDIMKKIYGNIFYRIMCASAFYFFW